MIDAKELKIHMQRHLNLQTDENMTFSELFEIDRRYLQDHYLPRRYDLADRFAEHMAATLDHLLEQKQ